MMDFSKAYSRTDFVDYLRRDFLPDDFEQEESNVPFWARMNYASAATCLGKSKTLDLVVYEIRHRSRHDARVGLSKDAFRMLAGEKQSRALVIFVPEDDADNYRFSLIEIQLSIGENDSNVTRTYSNPRRYSYYLGKGIACYTPNKYLNELGKVKDVKDLFGRFSVEVLTKAFYQELSDWYAWAIKVISFPNDISTHADDKQHNHEGAIRLITRLIFVWFLKERKLIPWQFFDQKYIADHLIKGFNPHKIDGLSGKQETSVYYRAILQNLFFAMLNCPITKEGGTELTERRFKDNRSQFDDNKLMRYRDEFNDPDEFLRLANETVPFLNGGLFDCLDEKRTGMYYDGFSERKESMAQLVVPDYLFFGEEAGKNIDLSEFYGDANKKKVSARGIIDILKRYNFTVEENMPFDKDVSLDPELLGKVFENLLASYNPETQQTARKQTGSFYTPREIVQYMVDESLVAHLKRTVGDELEGEYRKLLAYTDNETTLTEQQKLAIMQSLYNCKILDPACGSGAFPVGVLQQMVHILTQIDPDNTRWKDMLFKIVNDESSETFKNSTPEERKEQQDDLYRSFNDSYNRPDYSRKLYLIENCIYGVDIQPIAIQISKLRFFISLVVDQKINNNPADNFGIRPLPNLEAKFVAANSLIGLNRGKSSLFDNYKIKDKEVELKRAKHKIFSAKTSKTKEKYWKQVRTLRKEIADLLIEQRMVGNEQAQQLEQWDMFDQNSFAPFFDSDWMFGVKDGFDIVIANPPYIQLQNNDGELAKLYAGCGYKTFARTGDIYCLFYEHGWNLLKDGGHLCYITSNKWMRAGYGEKTRDFFAKKTNPLLLVDFAGVKIFESATVDTNILLFSKAANEGHTICAVTSRQDKDGVRNLSVFVRQHHSVCSFAGADPWIVLSEIEQSIKRKIEAVGTPLKDWDIQINYGIKTGCNDAFIINSEKRDEILADCTDEAERARTNELIRPILRGRDIKRYGYDWAGLWLINTHNGIKGVKPRIKIEDYPAVKRHLDRYWDKIKNRADQGDTPYNLRNCAYVDDFCKPKVVWKRVGSILRFCYNNNGALGLDSTCFATGNNIEFICCVLNSPMGHYLLKDAPKTGTGDLLISVQAVEPIKVPMITKEQNYIFEEALKELIHYGSTQREKEISHKVFDLYNLSHDERKYIESNFT